MPSAGCFAVVLVAVLGNTGVASAAEKHEYPPHRPLRSPWFEGWFTRVTLADWSLAFAIGHLPNQTTSSPAAACLLIINSASNSTNSNITPQLYSQFFTGLNISNGRCAEASKPEALDGVAHDRRDRNLQESESESARECGEYVVGHVAGDVERDFVLTGANGTLDQWCELSYEGKRLSLHGVYGDVELRVEMEHKGEFTPWAPDHITEGWLPSSATRLHWYVHSLSTPVRVWLTEDPQTRTGSLRDSPSQAGVAHLEKNWGESFPDGWLWAQGHLVEEEEGIQTTQAAFALAGGALPTAVKTFSMYAFSYYSPSFNASIDPWNPPFWFSVQEDSCQGTVTVKLYSLKYTVEITSSAPPESFTPVWTPTTEGFQEQAVESYSATTDVTIYGWDSTVLQLLDRTAKRQSGARSGGVAGQALLSHSVFPAAALEFGGNRRCNQSAST